MTDLHFVHHGSIVTCTPQTEIGRHWIDTNVCADDYMWLGKSLCIEQRFARDIWIGAIADGLEVD